MRPKYVSEIPRLAKEYSERNLTPADRMYARTTALLWWQCKTCSYEWQAPGNRRLQGSKCPACDGKVVTAENNLAVCYPQLAKEYSSRNELPASQVTPRSSHPFVWQCTDTECGYEWIETGSSRAQRFKSGYGCPECFESSSLNQISIEQPEVFAEYSDRNKLPSPLAWWTCTACGHEYRSRTSKRLKDNVINCPVCSGKIVTEATRLDFVYPNLAAELGKDMQHLAEEISIHSERERLWHCPTCKKKWWASPRKRIAGKSCPRCSVSKKTERNGSSVADQPIFLKEYSERNVVRAEDMPLESNDLCWWLCSSCNFAYMVSPQERIHQGTSCPVCAALKAPLVSKEALQA
jgi:ssDNA-binding Zn-finger/Zn-ribbon topoisomerase 1